MIRIHFENSDCRPAHGRSPEQDGSIPPEVPAPFLPARIEQPLPAARLRVDSSQVWSLEVIVRQTNPSEIGRPSQPAMLAGDNVIDLEWSRHEKRGQQAVFTTVVRPPPNELL